MVWPLHHPEGAVVNEPPSRAAPSGRWTALFFGTTLASCGVCLFGRFIPIPPKSGLEAVDAGLPPPGVPLSFFAETDFRFRGEADAGR